MIDEKYVVFKREEFQRWYQTVDSAGGTVPMALDDATVIRGQDLFAGPALHAYAASIAIAVKILANTDPDLAKSLRDVADYFSERAAEADEISHKLPD